MVIKRFEDIIAWQKAQDLALEIYRIFGNMKDFGFRDQICRAVVSISNNIAEGYDRDSDTDFRKFLIIAKGSANEVKSMIYLAKRLDLVTPIMMEEINERIDEIRKILSGLMRSLKPPVHKM